MEVSTTVPEEKEKAQPVAKEKSPSSSPDRRYSKSPSPSQKRRSKSPSASPRRKRRSPTPKPTKVCVSKLTRNVNKGHVEEIFSNYGKVRSVDLPSINSIPRGLAYVDYETSVEAEDALKYMNGGWIDGQEVSVQLVQPLRLPPLRERPRRSPPPRAKRRTPPRSWRGGRRSRSRSPRRRRSISPRTRRHRRRSRSGSAGSR